MNIPSKKRPANSVLGAVLDNGVQIPGMEDFNNEDSAENYSDDGLFTFEDVSKAVLTDAVDEDLPPWDVEPTETVKLVETKVTPTVDKKKPLQIVDDIPPVVPVQKKKSLKLDVGRNHDQLLNLMTSMS